MENSADEIGKLTALLADRAPAAYVLTVTDNGRPHATYAPVRWVSGHLLADVGKQTARNARARPAISLLFPVRAPDDYTLIVDGTATVDLERLVIDVAPIRAVLHRHGTSSNPNSVCSDDCVPVLSSGKAASTHTDPDG